MRDDRPVVHRVVGATLALAAAFVTVLVVRADPSDSLAGASALALAAEVAVGLALVAAALTARAGTAFRVLLATCGVAWLIGEWNSPGAGAAFTAGLVLYAAWPPLLAHAALRYGHESLGRAEIALLALAYLGALLLGASYAAFFDPVAQGCFDCPDNLLLVSDRPRLAHDLGRTGLLVAAVWSAAFVGIASLRTLRNTAARLRVELPVLLPATAAIVLFGIRALHSRERGFLSNDPTDRALWVGTLVALGLVALGVGWARLRARRMRAAVARLVVDLGESSAPGGLRDRLAAALGDPSLELVHALDDEPGWVDGDGRPAAIEPAPGREVTRLRAGGRELSAIVHRPGLLNDPGGAAELAEAVRLALVHERLSALRLAQLEDLQASRGRIVAAADAERRALERDLHDGAQQRLATLSIAIRLARRRQAGDLPKLDAELAAAEDGVREALAELRELAHGLIPSVLAHEGLRPAVEALADGAPQLLVVGALPSERFAETIESAAYFVVAESLRRSGQGDVAVSARRANARLRVELGVAGGIVGPLTDLEDRVGAVGGTLTVTAHDVCAELPCGS
jgi:signal transduction histidine kinase